MHRLVNSDIWKKITGKIYLITTFFILLCVLLIFMGLIHKIVDWMFQSIGEMTIIHIVFAPTAFLVIVSYIIVTLDDTFSSK
jgi:hypothetical protein